MRGSRIILLTSLCALVLAGCPATYKAPISADYEQLVERRIDSIVLMPVVDARKDRSVEMDFERTLGDPVAEVLREKGYAVTRGGPISAPPEEVAEMSGTELAALGPPDAQALLFVFVEDTQGLYQLVSYYFKIEASALLVGTAHGAQLWRDKGFGEAQLNGLVSGALTGPIRTEATAKCRRQLMQTFPSVSSGKTALLLPPRVSFQRLTSDKPVAPEEYGRDEIVAAIRDATRQNLLRRGIRPIDPGAESPQDASARAAIAALVPDGSVLGEGSGPTAETLARVRELTGASIACQAVMHVLVAESESQNLPGRVSSSSSLRLTVISLEDGSTIWERERFGRKLPDEKFARDEVESALEDWQ